MAGSSIQAGGAEPHLFAASCAAQTPHERVSFVHDRDTGLQTIIAVHDTRRGPAYGGCRITGYPSVQAALTDALRLSEGMSLKNALAELPFGGGKAVIIEPNMPYDRPALMAAFGGVVDSLQGKYITAEDVGSSVADMENIRTRTEFVGGLPLADGRDGDPSPYTAYGVLVGMRAAAKRVLGVNTMSGLTVAIQGLGSVGYALAKLLSDDGANLIVADINETSNHLAIDELGARVVGVDEILFQPCDVLAPCAMGAVLTKASIASLNCRLVCGAANNQLATAPDGQRIKDRGITYLPDFLVNAGGIICAGLEYLDEGGDDVVRQRIDGIDERVNLLLRASEQSGMDTHLVAERWARQLIVDPDVQIERAMSEA